MTIELPEDRDWRERLDALTRARRSTAPRLDDVGEVRHEAINKFADETNLLDGYRPQRQSELDEFD